MQIEHGQWPQRAADKTLPLSLDWRKNSFDCKINGSKRNNVKKVSEKGVGSAKSQLNGFDNVAL